jgi:hypothetical protein
LHRRARARGVLRARVGEGRSHLAVPRQLTHVWARRTLSNRCCQLPWAWLLLANAPPRPPREDCLLNPFDLEAVDPPRIAPVVLPRVADPKAACGVDCATRVLEVPVKFDGLLPRPRPVAPVFGSMVVALANDCGDDGRHVCMFPR